MVATTVEPDQREPDRRAPEASGGVEGPAGWRRGLVLAGLLFAAFLATSFIVATVPEETGLVTLVLQRVLASAIGAGGVLGAVRAFSSPGLSLTRRVARLALALVGTGLVWWLYLDREGVRGAVHSVVLALVLSASLFVLANRWLDQSLRAWARFTGITGAVLGLLAGAILVGNDAMGFFAGTAGSRVDRSLWLVPIVGVLGGLYGTAVGGVRGSARLVVGVAGGAGLGALVGAFLRTGSLPALEAVPLLALTLGLAALGGLLARLRGRDLQRGALIGAAWGWLIGAFGVPELGAGTVVEAMIGTAVLGALVGLRLGLGPAPEVGERLRIEGRVRTVIFLAPALTFLSAALIVPTLRTIYISFLEGGSGDFVGMDNFAFIFGQPSFYNVSEWRAIFGAGEFLLFGVALTVALLMAVRQRRAIDGVVPPRLTGSAVVAAALVLGTLADRGGLLDGLATSTWPIVAGVALVAIVVAMVDYLRRNPGNSGFSGPGGGFLGAAALMLSFAVFVQLRGTLFNLSLIHI